MSELILSTRALETARIAALRDRLANYCGVYLDDTRRIALSSAVQRRAKACGLHPAVYTDELGTPAGLAELQLLAEELLNHETLFFRNRPHMEALSTTILPELHRRLPPGEPLRIWSAGCATGEEPYSIAISALETLGDPPGRPIQILATDLSASALARARAGIYRGRTLSNLTPERRERFFTGYGETLTVSERVRQMVTFEQRNLIDPFPASAKDVHVIFCQNVTIYFQIATCRSLMGRFYEIMAEGGTLFLGFSETLWNIFDRFRWREVAGAYVYYKESQPGGAIVTRGPTLAPASARTPVQRSGARQRQPMPLAGPELAEQGRVLLDAGQVDRALELFYAAPLAGPQAPQILALAARAHANRGDLDLAAAEARRALDLDPLTTEAYLLIGLVYARQDQPGEAIRQLERARYLDSGSALISFHLAECYRQDGRSEGALREYRNTIRKLAAHPPDQLIDGVAVRWLIETCRRYVALLGG